MMVRDLAFLLLAASLASGASIPRQDPDILNARQDSGDPPFQDIPTTAKPDNTFSNGAAAVGGRDPTNEIPPEVYGNRSIDIPFGRLYVRNVGVYISFLRADLERALRPVGRGFSLRMCLEHW